MTYEIEKNLPMPPIKGGTKYPWASLNVGDSFLVGFDKGASVRSGVTYAGKKLKRKFICRKEETGYRVWRIK